MQIVQINKKVFEVNLQTYIQAVIDKNNIHDKKLKPQQIRFLAYPFITSIFWAKRKGKRVAKKNVYLYYSIKQKQYTLFLN
ncbi:MAG: hypothetical protein ACYDCN_11800 [Bacteroidia bacterium]